MARRQEKLTVPVLKKRLDVLLRESVRRFKSKDGLRNVCVTCRREKTINELQAGHFIKRSNAILKYDRTNLGPQCRRCNRFMNGCQDKMAYYIIQEHGLDRFLYLVDCDYDWLDGKYPPLKRIDYVSCYNRWLAMTRELEDQFGMKLIPRSWDVTS